MLSGYLYATRGVRPGSLVRLLLSVLFYSVVITLVVRLLMPDVFADKVNYLRGLLPSLFGYYWYITCYVVVFCLIPWTNKLLRSLDKAGFQKLLLVMFLLLSVLPTFTTVDLFKTGHGYSPWWLLYCYMIGAYLRLYPARLGSPQRLLFATNIVIVVAVCALAPAVLGERSDRVTNVVAGYDSVFNVINAAFIVEWFATKGISLGDSGECIAESLSRHSFGVYLIHCHNLIFAYILKDAFSFFGEHWWCALGVLFVVILIYLACYVADVLKDLVFERALGGRIENAATVLTCRVWDSCKSLASRAIG